MKKSASCASLWILLTSEGYFVQAMQLISFDDCLRNSAVSVVTIYGSTHCRSRIMAKWGFAGEGSGLGRAQQGAAEPIRAVQRPRNRGLGAE